MNYRVHFEDNKASRCELVKNINDMADYTVHNKIKIIRSLVVNAHSEKEAIEIANRLVKKFEAL